MGEGWRGVHCFPRLLYPNPSRRSLKFQIADFKTESPESGDQTLNYVTVDIGQSTIDAAIAKGQARVIVA